MSQLFHIFKYKIKTNSRIDFKFRLSDIIKEISTFFVYTAFAVGTYFFAKTAIHVLLDQLRIGNFLLHQFISIIFFIFFLSVNVGNIVVSWSTLYKSQEINFYFTKPVAPYKLFIVKFIDNIFYSSSTLLLILIAAFLAYLSYYNLNVFQLLYILLLNLLPFIFTAAALGVIILMMMVKLASRVGAKNLFVILAVIYLAMLVVFFDTLSPMNLVYNVLARYPEIDLYYIELIPKSIRFLPNQLFADSLYWLINENYYIAFFATIKQIMLSLGVMAIAFSLGHLWYYDTWLQNIRISSDKKKKIKYLDELTKNLLSSSSRFVSVISKDLIMFFRDSTQVIHTVVLFVLIVIFMTSTAGISYSKFKDISLVGTIYLSIYIFIILLISTLSLRFIFPLISLEGSTFWKIKSSPLNNLELSNYKLLPFAFLIMGIAFMLTFFSHLKLAPHLLRYSLFSILPVSYCLIMLNYSMGIFFVKFKEKNPIRIASSKGASITFLISLIYMIIVSAILFLPIQEHFTILLTSNYFLYKYISEAHYIISIISLLIGTTFYLAGVRALKKDY